MSYNNSRNYNTRNSGRYNRPGTFTPASAQLASGVGTPVHSSSSRPHPISYQSYDVQNSQPATPTRAVEQPRPQAQPQPLPPPPLPPQIQLQPQPEPLPENNIQQDDIDMMDNSTRASSRNEEWGSTNSSRQPTPFKTKLLGIKKISNKERRRRQNALLRRLTTPKNALMCINEMLPNEQITNQFKVELTTPDNTFKNNGTPNFCAELELKGINYKGYGDNKLSARNAAAEQAIRDIVLKKMERYSELMAQQAVNEPEGPPANDTAAQAAVDAILEADGSDALPMIQLLSFALHKLFAEWESAGLHVPPLRGKPPQVQQQVNMEEDGASRPVKNPNSVPMANKPKKPKKIPDNASSMHPAMLLTMLRPHATYRELASEGDKPQNMIFTFAVETEDKTFIGRAPNKKEARKAAARAACKGILGITFDDEKNITATN